jgi:hypothetical protein
MDQQEIGATKHHTRDTAHFENPKPSISALAIARAEVEARARAIFAVEGPSGSLEPVNKLAGS